jgi:hypothetical protein
MGLVVEKVHDQAEKVFVPGDAFGTDIMQDMR